MGQARRRKQQLGSLYGTPEGSNRDFLNYKDPEMKAMDETALVAIQEALSSGKRVVIWGDARARPLAKAAGLPWLHELPASAPIPDAIACDLELAVMWDGPMPPDYFDLESSFWFLSHGSHKWLRIRLEQAEFEKKHGPCPPGYTRFVDAYIPGPR